MLPHLTMSAGYSPSFPDRASLTQRPRCAGGKEHHIDPRTGNALCHCHFPFGAPPSFPLSPTHNAEGRTGHNSPNHSPVAVHLPPYDEGASLRDFHDYMAMKNSMAAKNHMTSRSIPIGGPYTSAALAAYHPYLYTGYEQGGIRKAAVRETTGPLKAWLHEHKKNPYPTKAEKVMLAIITQMTLTQVSTWFANARRRLKKETRGGWDGSSDHDDDKDSNGRPDGKDTDSTNADNYDNFSDVSVDDDDDDDVENNVAGSSNDSPSSAESPPVCRIPYPMHSFPPHHPFLTSPLPLHAASLPLRPEVTSENARSPGNGGSVGNRTNNVAAAPAAGPKPRIWSISAIIGLDEKDSDSVAEKEEKSSCSSSDGDKKSSCSSSDGDQKSSCSSSDGDQIVDSAACVSGESDSTDSVVADSELVCSTSSNHQSPVSPNSP